MTDQTVPVPVAVLQRLRGGFLEERPVEGTITARREAVLEVLDYIPTPPKVGDKLTATQVVDLPFKAVVVDKDGDPWTVVANGQVVYFIDDVTHAPKSAYAPYTLVYLPSRD